MLFFSAAVYGKYIFETRHPLPLLDILFLVSSALAIHCFVIDRIVLNDKIMNRNFKYALILAFQTLMAILFLVYALYQKAEAETQHMVASEMEKRAVKLNNEYLKDLEECRKERIAK
jgi:hypothetical protein